jgi:hypothetical protein
LFGGGGESWRRRIFLTQVIHWITFYEVTVITVAETTEYAKRARKLLSEKERAELICHLAAHPEAGDVMEGTGGVRKVRWAREGKGKSGGVRVVYFYYNEGMPLYLLTLYGKSEKDNLSAGERNDLAKLVNLLVRAARKR